MNSPLALFGGNWPWTSVDLLNHLWQSTVVAVAVLVILAVGRTLTARTRRVLGWLALAKFALPATFVMNAFARLGATPSRWVDSGALAGPVMSPGFMATVSTVDAPVRFSTEGLMTASWLAIFATLFIAWLIRGLNLRRRILSEAKPLPAEMEKRVAAAAGRVGLSEAPRCLVVGSECGPGLLGIFAPVLILPRGLETTLTPAEFEAVLIHEFVHLRRRDTFWGAMQAFFVCLFWFHPVVWLLNHRLGIETEQACDERVLEITGDPDTYAGGIVKSVHHALGVAQPGWAGATTPPVLTRIKNILAHGTRPNRPILHRLALVAGVLLLLLSGYTGSFAVKSLAATPNEAATPVATTAPVAAPVPEKKEDTLSIDFPDEDIREVLKNVADLFRLNIVIPATLQGSETSIKLDNLTWRQIFTAVLKPVGYTFVENGNIVKVVRIETLGAEPLTTEVFKLTRVDAADLPARIVPMVDPSVGGKVIADVRSNSLVVTERSSRMDLIRSLIMDLERVPDPAPATDGLIVKIFMLKRASVADVLAAVTALIDPASDSRVVGDTRAKAIIVTERASRLARIQAVIEQLEQAGDRVQVEPSEAFRSFVQNLKIIAVSETPPRIFANDHQYRVGATLDRVLGVKLISVAPPVLVFEEKTGARLSKSL